MASYTVELRYNAVGGSHGRQQRYIRGYVYNADSPPPHTHTHTTRSPSANHCQTTELWLINYSLLQIYSDKNEIAMFQTLKLRHAYLCLNIIYRTLNNLDSFLRNA